MKKKRSLLLVMMLVLVFLLSGCSSILEKEYYSVEEYQGEDDDAEELDEEEGDDLTSTTSISNYAALRRAITSLVTEHAESAELQFQNYDGNISQDISAACWEVKSSTALGSFAVDYISYDLSRIVSYYQAEIYITYKRSAYQVGSLEQVTNTTGLAERLDEALRANETYLVLEITSAAVSPDTVVQYLQDAYYADPLACPILPDVDVGIYPESGVDRIIEITLDYGTDSDTLARMRLELGDAIDQMTAEVQSSQETGDAEETEEAGTDREDDLEIYDDSQDASGESTMTMEPEDLLYALCCYLADHCEVDAQAGDTAWDALVEGAASSEGAAMALEAGCQALGIDCQIIQGRMDGEDHTWDIVTLGDSSYHVDVSDWTGGPEDVFLKSDTAISGVYWWDNSEYPSCAEDLDYFGLETGEASEEIGSPDGDEEPEEGTEETAVEPVETEAI